MGSMPLEMACSLLSELRPKALLGALALEGCLENRGQGHSWGLG